jgi:hypothetical protein
VDDLIEHYLSSGAIREAADAIISRLRAKHGLSPDVQSQPRIPARPVLRPVKPRGIWTRLPQKVGRGRQAGCNWTKPTVIGQIILLSRSGYPNREISRILEIDKRTVRKFAITAPCPCGLDRQHRGWCWYRFARSERRQQMLNALPRRTPGGARGL